MSFWIPWATVSYRADLAQVTRYKNIEEEFVRSLKKTTLAALIMAAVTILCSRQEVNAQQTLTFQSALAKAITAVQNRDTSIIGNQLQRTNTGVYYNATFQVAGMSSAHVRVDNATLREEVFLITSNVSQHQAGRLYGTLKGQISSVLGANATMTEDQDSCDFSLGSVTIRLDVGPGGNPNFVDVSVIIGTE